MDNMSQKDGTDPVLQEVIDLIQESHYSLTYIANKGACSQSTLRNWVNGKTKRPQRITMDFVLRVFGKRLVIVDDPQHNIRRR